MRRISPRRTWIVLIVSLTCLAGLSPAQSASEQQDYQVAVSKPTGPERTAALENFAAAHPGSRLKIDALELLVWEARDSARVADLEYWTGQLISVSPGNPLGVAMIVGKSLNIGSDNRLTLAKRTVGSVEGFDRPEGLPHDEFSRMKSFVVGALNGVVGYNYFEQKDYVAARPYLRRAVEGDPSNAQYTYTLALCDLQGANPDQGEGYAMLARSVNLTKGTPAGDRLAAYARQNFQQAGGTSQGWDQYLAATVTPASTAAEAPAVAANTASPTHGENVVAATTPAAPVSHEPILVASTAPSVAPTATTAAPSVGNPPAAPAASSGAVASAAPPPSPDVERPLRVFPARPARHIAPGAPVSIGVLIQASLAAPANRKPVVFTLSDLVRHLREKDEAFIMSFSRGVVFQEDLTSNSKLLENAMDSIAPTPGSAIYDAVTFAAGHLDRVARNKNRVLLVIAAEGDRNSTVSPLELSSEINLSGVTIYCIGVGVASPADRDRLEALAGSTGGQAVFISDLSNFRQATDSIARGLGVGFPQ